MTNSIARTLVVIAAVAVLSGSSGGVEAAPGLPVIQGLVAAEGEQGPEIRLATSELMETVHYSPQPGVWVVEMPEAEWSFDPTAAATGAEAVTRVQLEHAEEFGKRNSRLTVHLAVATDLELAATGSGLTLRFVRADAVAELPQTDQDEAPTPTASPLAKLPPVSAVAQPARSVRPQVAQDGPVRLVDLRVQRVGEGVQIDLDANAPLAGRAFRLSSPERLVVDLDGVVNVVPRQVYSVGSPLVRRVRVAQFKGHPDPVTRLVVDLERGAEYRLESSASGGVLAVGADLQPTHAPSHAIVAQAEPTPEEPSSGTIEITRSRTRPKSSPVQSRGTAAAVDDRDAVTADVERDAVAERNPWIAAPEQLLEEAIAAREVDIGGETFESREVESDEVQFTGDPISLTLKDADIKDVLKTFSALTELNIVIDPEVSGSVTVELRDVPWDQALDLILRINGLDWVLENNVMRISTISKLSAEKAALSKFQENQENTRPLKTVIKPLSYAKADYVADLLSSDAFLLSSRGVVTVDERTNTLIIRDTVDRVEGILRLIDTLDKPTPQVVIEGRIVETTKDFSRQLGVSWGFTGVMDSDHGNDTGLKFPNNASVVGDVNLPAAATNGVIGLTFGDILNTFNLDFVLSAAERNGTARIVSTPRVTTQNLKQASIRSGLQVPVQTVANNTVTVTYVDATLRLQVTPQITAEGTVNLEIDIRKQQALQAGTITGGNNAPIQTRDVQTELLVRDGGTTVIGGIYTIDNQENENRVPGLGKIPVLRHLFRNTEFQNRHEELLIFITPRIVKY